jgi:hypothetical protein
MNPSDEDTTRPRREMFNSMTDESRRISRRITDAMDELSATELAVIKEWLDREEAAGGLTRDQANDFFFGAISDSSAVARMVPMFGDDLRAMVGMLALNGDDLRAMAGLWWQINRLAVVEDP